MVVAEEDEWRMGGGDVDDDIGVVVVVVRLG